MLTAKADCHEDRRLNRAADYLTKLRKKMTRVRSLPACGLHQI
jgi:hypothetical protein